MVQGSSKSEVYKFPGPGAPRTCNSKLVRRLKNRPSTRPLTVIHVPNRLHHTCQRFLVDNRLAEARSSQRGSRGCQSGTAC